MCIVEMDTGSNWLSLLRVHFCVQRYSTELSYCWGMSGISCVTSFCVYKEYKILSENLFTIDTFCGTLAIDKTFYHNN